MRPQQYPADPYATCMTARRHSRILQGRPESGGWQAVPVKQKIVVRIEERWRRKSCSDFAMDPPANGCSASSRVTSGIKIQFLWANRRRPPLRRAGQFGELHRQPQRALIIRASLKFAVKCGTGSASAAGAGKPRHHRLVRCSPPRIAPHSNALHAITQPTARSVQTTDNRTVEPTYRNRRRDHQDRLKWATSVSKGSGTPNESPPPAREPPDRRQNTGPAGLEHQFVILAERASAQGPEHPRHRLLLGKLVRTFNCCS